MRFKRYGNPQENLTATLRPIEKADEFVFARLDAMLDMLRVSHPEQLLPFVDSHSHHIRELGAPEETRSGAEIVSALTQHYPQLATRQDHVHICLDVFLAELQISMKTFQSNEAIEVADSRFQLSAMRGDHALYLALRDLFGRDEALRLYKRYTDSYIDTHDKPLLAGRGFASLSALRSQRIRVAELSDRGRVRTISTVENGMLIERCENCEKVAGLTNVTFEDPEVFSTILCYSDFPVTRLLNDQFVLTRRKTIARGDSYCDNVYHDIRVASTVEHPDEGFIMTIDKRIEA